MDETNPALSSQNGTKEPSVRSNRSNRTQSPPIYSPPKISSPSARSPTLQLSQPKLISSPVRSISPTKISNILPPKSPSLKSSKRPSLQGSRIVSGARSPDSHGKSISNKIQPSNGSYSERNKTTDSGSNIVLKTKNGADPGATTTITSSINDIVMSLEPQGQIISDHVEQLTDTINDFAKEIMESQPTDITSNVDKITTISKVLTNEAQVLRESIKSLSDDISRTQRDICYCGEDSTNPTEDVNFPYHLFLVEIIVNKIHMKCDCFELNFNNLVISAKFLGKQPVVLYDHSFGKIYDFSKLNVGKSTLFAMSYDKICSIKDFEIVLSLTNEPPCSDCVTKIAESRIDQTDEFITLREELCSKWTKEQPTDNIQCSASTPMSKNMYYLTCGKNAEIIGVVEVTIRMSFLGKEITTAFCGSNKPRGNSFLLKEDRGMSMYSCQKVEMDEQGKILLDEDALTDKYPPCPPGQPPNITPCPPMSNAQVTRPYCPYIPYNNHDTSPKYDEICTKMNANELKIRVPKSTKVERTGQYDKIQELCSCESTAYNTGEQIQFELPRDAVYPEKTYTSNMSYTINKLGEKKDRKIINVTPTDCSVPVDMTKVVHPRKDVFILKIGKKLETKDKKTDLEIELVTPKAIPEKPTEISDNAQQYSHSDTEHSGKKKAKKSKKKSKGMKGGGKGKKGKRI